jgi:hypothetical protein
MAQIQNCTDPLLFIRSEEPAAYPDLGNRIPLPQYTDEYQNDELYYLRQFSETVKQINPNLKFKILFLSSNGQMIDEEHNIVGIPLPNCDYRDPFISKRMLEAISAYDDFLNQHL